MTAAQLLHDVGVLALFLAAASTATWAAVLAVTDRHDGSGTAVPRSVTPDDVTAASRDRIADLVELVR